MSQLHPPGESAGPTIPSAARVLLTTLADACATQSSVVYPTRDLATDTTLNIDAVRDYLRWLAINGYLTYTVTNHGEHITLISDGTTNHIELTGTPRTDGPPLELPPSGYAAQLRHRLGYAPHPDPLRITVPTSALESITERGIPLPGPNEHSQLLCYPVTSIATATATCTTGHVIPDAPAPDDGALTIFAPVNLQTYLNLDRDSTVTISL